MKAFAMCRLLIVGFLTFQLLTARAAHGQAVTGCTPTLAQLKIRMLELRDANSDDAAFLKAFDESVGFDKVRTAVVTLPSLLPDVGVILYTSDDKIAAFVSPPYWRYSKAVKEALRKREPIGSATAIDGVAVDIYPSTIDAPDIVKVILERDGRVITPLLNTLKPTPLATRIGARVILHQGSVVYPCSAFSTGSRVVLTLIPDVGTNIVKTFNESETWLLGPHAFAAIVQKAPPAIPIATLKGLTAAAVRERLGNPTVFTDTTWSFATADHGTLQIFFLQDGTVSSALPNDFDLAWLQKR